MFVCIYVCMYRAVPWGSLTLLSFIRFVLTCGAIQSSEKYSRTRLRNANPAQSLRRTFSRRNSRKKNRSDSKMAAPEDSVHPVRNCLCYHFSLYQTNESCYQSVSRSLMLLRSFNKSCLRFTAPNATEAERPFYEHCRMVLHATRRLLLQLLASALSSHVRFQILDSSYQFN